MFLWMSFNAAETVGTYDVAVFSGVPQLLRFAVEGHFSTGPVLLAIACIPYSFSYLTERDCDFKQQAVERVGLFNYSACKAVATFLSAFLMGVVAVGAFIGVLSVMGIPHTVRYDEVQHSYAVLVETMGPGWYYAVKLLHIGLVCGQAAVFSLMIMAWIPNSYVGFLSPLIGYYLIECIEFLLARVIYNPFFWRLINGQALLFGQAADNLLLSYLWTVFLLIAMSLGFGICFIIQLEKELEQ